MATRSAAESRTVGDETGNPRWRLSKGGGFWLVVFLVVTGLLGSYSLTPLYSVYQAQWHFSDLMLSVAFACYSLGTVVALLLFGSLSDRLGRRAAFVPALLGVAVSLLVLMFAVNLPMLLVGRALQGIFTGIINGTAGAALMDLEPHGDRRVAAFANSTSIAAGSALGPLIAGFLVAHAPLPTRTPYLLILVLLAVGLAGVAVLPETVDRASQAASRAADGGFRRLRMPERRAVFVVACLGAITCSAGMALFAEFGTQLAGQVGLNGASMGGLLVFVMFAAIGLVQVLLRRLGHLTSLVTGAIGTAAGWAGIVAALSAHQAAAMFAAAVVAGAGAGLAFMGATAGVNHVAAPERRAEAVSLYFVVLFLALAVPGIGGGALAQAIGLTGTAAVMLVLAAAIAIVLCVAARHPRVTGGL
ncbi:MAG TPA: MFS transporter [Trebonia sp.]|nr:MFS transporter [Trebonia sp.]